MDKVRKPILHLILTSLKIDKKFLSCPVSLKLKAEILLKKYYLFVKHLFIPYSISKSYIKISNQKFYYSSYLGLTMMQEMYAYGSDLIKDISINPKSTIIDIGAHEGTFSIMVKNFFPSSTIHAIEPIEETYKLLKSNLEFFDNVYTYQLAIYSENKKIKMSKDMYESNINKIDDKGDVEVEAITLDNFYHSYNLNKIDVIKIDTETFERQVIEGGRETLENSKYIIIEVNLKDNLNYTFSQLMGLLYEKKFNYQLLKINYFLNNDRKYEVFDCLLENLEYKSVD